MLRIPPFRLHRPTRIDEAARLLADGGPADGPIRVVAGGTDLWPNLKRQNQRAATVVSLSSIPGLDSIRSAPGSDLELGATATLTAIERDPVVGARFPALAHAVSAISSPLLRNMGTIGGNLCLDTRCTYYDQNEEWRRSIHYCMKAEGEICWVAPSSPRCWAVSSSDAAPMLIALGARVRLVSTAGEREIPVAALYRDDGIDYLTKRPEEIVTAITVPATSDSSRLKSAFFKLRRRGSIDFGVLSVAVALRIEGGVVAEAKIVLGSVGSFPIEATDAAAFLVGHPPDPERFAHAGELARPVATPMDNTDLDPRWRGQVIPVHVRRTLAAAAGV